MTTSARHPRRSARRLAATASTTAGLLVASPFVELVLQEAIAAAGLTAANLKGALEPPPVLRLLVADLDSLGPRAAEEVVRWNRTGTAVLVLGRQSQDAALRALAALGAHTGTRAELLARLPDLLAGLLSERRTGR